MISRTNQDWCEVAHLNALDAVESAAAQADEALKNLARAIEKLEEIEGAEHSYEVEDALLTISSTAAVWLGIENKVESR